MTLNVRVIGAVRQNFMRESNYFSGVPGSVGGVATGQEE